MSQLPALPADALRLPGDRPPANDPISSNPGMLMSTLPPMRLVIGVGLLNQDGEDEDHAFEPGMNLLLGSAAPALSAARLR